MKFEPGSDFIPAVAIPCIGVMLVAFGLFYVRCGWAGVKLGFGTIALLGAFSAIIIFVAYKLHMFP